MPDRPTGGGERRDRALADAEAQALGAPARPTPQPLPQASPLGPFDAVKRLFNSITHTYVGSKPEGK